MLYIYNLEINIWTNNDYIQITNTYIESWNKNDWEDKYNIVANNNYYNFSNDYWIIWDNSWINTDVINTVSETYAQEILEKENVSINSENEVIRN